MVRVDIGGNHYGLCFKHEYDLDRDNPSKVGPLRRTVVMLLLNKGNKQYDVVASQQATVYRYDNGDKYIGRCRSMKKLLKHLQGDKKWPGIDCKAVYEAWHNSETIRRANIKDLASYRRGYRDALKTIARANKHEKQTA